jgi:hypothetical protein
MTASSLMLTDHQYTNLLGIIAAVKSRPATRNNKLAAYVIVSAALAESGMQMYASANVPDSLNHPHVEVSWTYDGLGHDHASCGMLQQQTGYAWTPAGYGTAMNQTTIDSPNGWGTPAQLMDPVYSANAFLAAMETKAWTTQSAWVTAQDVQHSVYDGYPRPSNHKSSEYGGNYHDSYPRAVQLVDAVWASEAASDSGTPITIPEDGMFEIIHDTSEPTVGFYAWSLGAWRLISGSTQLQMAQASGMAAHGGTIRSVTHAERLRIQNLALGH